MATFVQSGDRIDYSPVAATSAGAVVVQNDLVGVAVTDIPAGGAGALAVCGVFSVPKAAEAIAVGEKCWWDAANSRVTKTKGQLTVLFGKAVSAAASGDATVNVLLNEGPSA